MNKHAGSTVESLFEELGELSEVRLLAAKKVLAEELRRLMAARSMTEAALARAMATSRTTVRRLLDPADTGVTLATLARAGAVLGQRAVVRFVGERPHRRGAGGLPPGGRLRRRPAKGTRGTRRAVAK
jgi:antitoxin HicB